MTERGAASSPWAGGDGPELVQPWRPDVERAGAAVGGDLFLKLTGARCVLVASYHDGSAVIGAWGPFADDVAANEAIGLLEASGVGANGAHAWAVVPLHEVHATTS